MDQFLALLVKIPTDWWYALCGGIGGIARLALGIKEDGKVSKKGELFRILFISMPIGWSVGHILASQPCWSLPWVGSCVPLVEAAMPLAILFGVGALPIVRKVATEGPIAAVLSWVSFKKGGR